MNVAHADWEQFFQTAILELDPTKLPDHIAAARKAILDYTADGHSRPLNEQHKLQIRFNHAEHFA